MAYTYKELHAARSFKQNKQGKTYNRTYEYFDSTRLSDYGIYQFVTTDGGTVGPLKVGDAHPEDTSCYITNIDCQDKGDDGKHWIVNIEWATPSGGGAVELSPTSRPPEIAWGLDKETIDVFKDYSPTPVSIVASNGEPFDDVPKRDRGLLTCSYTRNQTPTFFHSTVLPLMAFDVVVNNASFTLDGVTIPAYYARLEIRNAEKSQENGVTFYKVSYFFSFRAGFTGYASDGWRERYLDRGHYEWDGTDYVPIRDVDGSPVEKSWPLDGTGLAAAAPTAEPAVLGPFRLYPEVSFASLSFT